MELLRLCETHAQDATRLTPPHLRHRLRPYQYVGGPRIFKSALFAEAVPDERVATRIRGPNWEGALDAIFEDALGWFASMHGSWPEESSKRGVQQFDATLMFSSFQAWGIPKTPDPTLAHQRAEAWRKISKK